MSEHEMATQLGRLIMAQMEAKKQVGHLSAKVKEVADTLTELARKLQTNQQITFDSGDVPKNLLSPAQLEDLLRSRDEARQKLVNLNKDLADLGVRLDT